MSRSPRADWVIPLWRCPKGNGHEGILVHQDMQFGFRRQGIKVQPQAQAAC